VLLNGRNMARPKPVAASSSQSDKIFYQNINKKQRVSFSNPLFYELQKGYKEL